MVRQLSKILLFLLTVFSLMGETQGVGVIFPNFESSKELEKILLDELELNFEGSDIQKKIVSKSYLDKTSLKESMNSMMSNPKINGIFVLDYNDLNYFPGDTKFISYPLGLLPQDKKISGDINYIYGEPDILRDMMKLKELKEIKNIVIYTSRTTESYKKNVIEKLKKAGINSKFKSIDNTKEQIEKDLSSAEAVYIITNDAKGEKITKIATEKKLPTFITSLNSELIDKGLMGYELSNEINKRLRTAVFNYFNYLTGETENSVNDLGVLKDELFFNTSVANKIKIYPSILFIQGMKLSEDKNSISKLKLNFKDAIELALKNNPSLKAQLKSIEASKYSYWAGNTKRLPKASLGANYSYLDDTITKVSGSENSVVGLLKISQVIYDDSLNVDIYADKIAYENSMLQYNQGVLDTIFNVANTYFNLLQLESQLEIQNNNYDLVREFSRVSKIKYETGATGIQDVYRMEGVISDVTSSLADLQAQLKNQEKVFTTLLNIPIETQFVYQDIDELSNEFFMGKEFLDKFLFDKQKDTKLFSYFSEVALNNSNQLKAIENNIKILERQGNSLTRSRFIPKVSAFGQYSKNNLIDSWGAGSNVNSPNNWRAGIVAEIPIFTSGEIHYSKKSLDADIESLEYQKTDFENQLIKNVNVLSTTLLSDYVQTFTSKKASEAANKSLELSKNLYALGSISTTEILDAKNAAITSELSYTISSYNFFISAMNLERVLGRYKIFSQAQEREEEIKKLENIVGQ
ncbi:MAG: TolC family protein [Fusobacteriaceae bacterium]